MGLGAVLGGAALGGLAGALGGGKKKTKTSSSSTSRPIQEWMTPWQNIINRSQATGYTPYSGPTVAGFTPAQQQGQGMALNAANQFMPTVNPAIQQFNYALGPGADPFNNPAIDQMMAYARRPLEDQWTNTIAPSIRSGSIAANPYGTHSSEQVQQRQAMNEYMPRVFESQANVLGNLYESGQNRAMNAMSQAPMIGGLGFMPAQTYMDVGAMQQGLNQQQLAEAERMWNVQQMAPWQQMQMQRELLGSPIGMNEQSSGTTTTPSNRWGGALQGAVGGAMLGSSFGGGGGGGGFPAGYGGTTNWGMLPSFQASPQLSAINWGQQRYGYSPIWRGY